MVRRPAYSERKSAIRIPIGAAIRIATPTITAVPTRLGATPSGAGLVMKFQLIAEEPWATTPPMTMKSTATAAIAAATASPWITRLTAWRRRRLPVATSGWVGSNSGVGPVRRRKLIASPPRRC